MEGISSDKLGEKSLGMSKIIWDELVGQKFTTNGVSSQKVTRKGLGQELIV